MRKVSDECLGQMLAERYVMIKTAGFGEALSGGAQALGKNLTWFAPALALGGGIELVRHVMDSRRSAMLEQQADKNFRDIMLASDHAKGSPDIAREAFDTLKTIAPSLAARHIVAKTFIDFVARTDGRIPPETIQQLAQAEDAVRGIGGGKKPSYMPDMKSIMGIQTAKNGPEISDMFGLRKPRKR